MAKLQQQQKQRHIMKEETTKSAAVMLQRAQRAPEWVSVEKRVGQSIKAAIGRGARGQQIGRFIKRVSGWQIMSLTIRWAGHSQSVSQPVSQASTVSSQQWRKDIGVERSRWRCLNMSLHHRTPKELPNILSASVQNVSLTRGTPRDPQSRLGIVREHANIIKRRPNARVIKNTTHCPKSQLRAP